MERSPYRSKILTFFYIVQFSRVWALDDDHTAAFLKRREVIPLSEIGKQFFGEDEHNYNYRRTRDIQEEVKYKKQEDEDLQWHEANVAENKEQLDKINQEISWLTIQNENGRRIGLYDTDIVDS